MLGYGLGIRIIGQLAKRLSNIIHENKLESRCRMKSIISLLAEVSRRARDLCQQEVNHIIPMASHVFQNLGIVRLVR